MREITVTVQGLTGVGKSTVAHIVSEALRSAGFSVANNDAHPPPVKNQAKRVAALSEVTTITVNTVNLNRRPAA